MRAVNVLSRKIDKIDAREILDSRGNPTLEVRVALEDGSQGTAAVPSGASTGAFEAVELRDGEKERYAGKGVSKAIGYVNTELNQLLHGRKACCQQEVDLRMREADGTGNKGHFGANAILGVSLAAAKAAAASYHMPLYRYLGGIGGVTLPVPMMNIINGGSHILTNSLDVQEFMILPVGAPTLREGVRWCAEVYHSLHGLLRENGQPVAVGDEGGFAPNLSNEEEAVEMILEAIKRCGYSAGAGKDFMISLDVAASEWKDPQGRKGFYYLPKAEKTYTAEELRTHWKRMTEQYPIFSIEDPLDEEDWENWKLLTEQIQGTRLVGDDLFVTNVNRLQKGIEKKCGTAILIKPNQIGTLSETLQAVSMAHRYGMTAILSHRSGETEDTTIADLAVAWNTGYIKTGAPARGERTAKYNRLMQIEEELGSSAVYSK
ncbi:MAG: phosphopyruvate hydratase [Lachnospiraceae bacterium]|jgi:enolase|nr:phosphopyruvate hydratase [Lachnospiraceae bacterium]